jgi:zinc protease
MVMANYMLGGGFLNSRFAVRIRQKDGLSYGVSSGLSGISRQKHSRFLFAAICAPENAPKVEKAFKEEVARALKDGFTENEVEAAKKGWLQSQQVSRSQDAGLVAKLNLLSFSDRTLAFDAATEKKVQSLTAAQISDALRRNFKLEDISIFKAGDFKKANVQF